MNDVTLKFVGTGYSNLNQAKIWIYDENDCLMYKGNTYNGKVKVCLKRKHFYKIIAKTIYGEVEKNFYVNDMNTYVFAFNYSYIKSCKRVLVTFQLTDYYYNDLPIEKGEIFIWQR